MTPATESSRKADPRPGQSVTLVTPTWYQGNTKVISRSHQGHLKVTPRSSQRLHAGSTLLHLDTLPWLHQAYSWGTFAEILERTLPYSTHRNSARATSQQTTLWVVRTDLPRTEGPYYCGPACLWIGPWKWDWRRSPRVGNLCNHYRLNATQGSASPTAARRDTTGRARDCKTRIRESAKTFYNNSCAAFNKLDDKSKRLKPSL